MLSLKKLKDKKKGFTLIELIVVIAIIGILAAVLLPRFGGFTDSARLKSAKSEAKGVYTALEAVYAEKGAYPTSKENVEGIKKPAKIKSYNPNAKDAQPLFTYEIEGKTEVITCTASGDISEPAAPTGGTTN